MKGKRVARQCIAALLGLGMAASVALGVGQEASPPETRTFRVAASDVEKTLDRALRLSEKDENLLEFVLRTPSYKPKKDTGYARFFTERLLSDMAAMEKKTVQENCQGKYITGQLCGTDHNPLTCAQDMAERPYLYATALTPEGKVVVSYTWPGEKDRIAAFEMLQKDGEWKIDAVACHPDKSSAKP